MSNLQTQPYELKNDPFTFNPETMLKVDISGFWRLAQFVGTERINSKKGTKGWKQFGPGGTELTDKPHHEWTVDDYKSHHTGLFGEIAFALETGMQPDMILKPYGDGGEDFPGIDIKSTWSHRPTANKLIENCYKKDKMTKYYVQANIDFENKSVVLVGWCTRQDLCSGAVVNYGKGNERIGDDGSRFVLHYSDLKPMHTLPALVHARHKQMEKMQQFHKVIMQETFKQNRI